LTNNIRLTKYWEVIYAIKKIRQSLEERSYLDLVVKDLSKEAPCQLKPARGEAGSQAMMGTRAF
jgi:hypothetical protein